MPVGALIGVGVKHVVGGIITNKVIDAITGKKEEGGEGNGNGGGGGLLRSLLGGVAGGTLGLGLLSSLFGNRSESQGAPQNGEV